MLEQLKALGEKVAAQREAIKKEAQEAVKPALQDFMRAHPNIKAVGWTQYTPYFNDGDPCVFRFNEISASVSDERDDSLYGDGWEELYGEVPEGFSQQDWTDLVELNKTLSALEGELETVFGDHVRVIVTQDGVDVDEYEHD